MSPELTSLIDSSSVCLRDPDRLGRKLRYALNLGKPRNYPVVSKPESSHTILNRSAFNNCFHVDAMTTTHVGP